MENTAEEILGEFNNGFNGTISKENLLKLIQKGINIGKQFSGPSVSGMPTKDEIAEASYESHNIKDEGDADFAEKQFEQGANYGINRMLSILAQKEKDFEQCKDLANIQHKRWAERNEKLQSELEAVKKETANQIYALETNVEYLESKNNELKNDNLEWESAGKTQKKWYDELKSEADKMAEALKCAQVAVNQELVLELIDSVLTSYKQNLK